MPTVNSNYTTKDVSVSSFDTSLETLHIGITYTVLTRGGDDVEQFYQDYYLPKIGTSLPGEPASYGAPPVDVNNFDFTDYPFSVSGYNLNPGSEDQTEITFYISKDFDVHYDIVVYYVYQNVRQEIVHQLDPKYYERLAYTYIEEGNLIDTVIFVEDSPVDGPGPNPGEPAQEQ